MWTRLRFSSGKKIGRRCTQIHADKNKTKKREQRMILSAFIGVHLFHADTTPPVRRKDICLTAPFGRVS
jgi:hypothetical protein